MFHCMRNFLYSHRRKFYVTGFAIGGVAMLTKYVESRLTSWRADESRKLLEQHKRKQHYDRTLDMTRVTLLNLLPNIRKVLDQELNSDIFIEAIKNQPERKRELWEELKVTGFGRTLCTVICGAVVAPVSHVMMMVLAANTIDDNTALKTPVPLEVQTSYLLCLQDMIEEQMSDLVSRVMAVAVQTISSLPLTSKLTLQQLETVLQEVILSVTNDKNDAIFVDRKESPPITSVLPWSQYLREPEATMSHPDSNVQLRNMYLLTVDILNTDDFNRVVNTLVQIGINYVLDEMAPFYFSNGVTIEVKRREVASKATLSIANEEPNVCSNGSHESKLKPDVTLDQDPNAESVSKATEMEEIQSVSNSQKPQTNTSFESTAVTTTNDVNHFRSFELLSCVVVKLVPMLSGILHKALSNLRHLPSPLLDTRTSYYKSIVLCGELEALAYNVYETLVLNTVGASHQM